jgi:uncharacterized protein YbjT (DUF2867 family)
MESQSQLNIVTGAFGFSGRHIARRLLQMGERVRTLTNHPQNSQNSSIEIARLNFGDPDSLAVVMRGANVLYNTYWVRFAYAEVSHKVAVENTKMLIRAAELAGIKRIVHVSITNPAAKSISPYFSGKAEVEQAIQSSSLSYAILRPAVLFGEGGILINNIAWLLRTMPLFLIPGGGEYRLQPIFVEDLAELAVETGHREENIVVDAVGPETFTYDELVRLIRSMIGSRSLVWHVPPALVRGASRMLGLVVNDVVLTSDEVRELMSDVLVSSQPPTGQKSLRQWLATGAETLGRKYSSELDRHYRDVVSTTVC